MDKKDVHEYFSALSKKRRNPYKFDSLSAQKAARRRWEGKNGKVHDSGSKKAPESLKKGQNPAETNKGSGPGV